MTFRLSRATLDRLPADVQRPRYDLSGVRTGIVHLGVGAFHRAHQAVYVDDCLAAGEIQWGICGVSLRSTDTRDALATQDDLYTLATRGADGEQLRVIGSITRLLAGEEERERILEAMSDPAVGIVSLTVTEKGYCHDPATGHLREDRPDIRADLADPRRPRSAPGYLVEAIRRRRDARVSPFAILCCDNLPANGRTVGRIVGELGHLIDPELGRFITSEVACPSTMVDRIVPATTDTDRASINTRLGLEDAWPVVTEPFTQWVIEDHFPGGRPRLEECGVEMVRDVAPFEAMKLRLLNASHSGMAYLGYLSGCETISDTIALSEFCQFARGVMHEASTTLKMPPGVDVAAYCASLLQRFANPALKHRTWQIAMDGSQKLPQRLLGSIRDRLAADRPIAFLSLAVAGWMRYVTGIDECGQPIDVRDPLSATLRAMADAAGPRPDKLVPALLAVKDVFGDDLPRDPRFVKAAAEALTSLYEVGARNTVQRWVTKHAV